MKWKGALFILAFVGGLLLNRQPVTHSPVTPPADVAPQPSVTLLQISDMVMSLFSILDQAQVASGAPSTSPLTDGKPAITYNTGITANCNPVTPALSISPPYPANIPLHLYLRVLRI